MDFKSKSITCDHCENWFCMECSNITKKIFDGIITCNQKKEDVSMLIFICERCRANDTDLKDMKRDISDIKKELSKMCNDIGESSTDIKTHIEKKLKVPRNFNPNVVDKRILLQILSKNVKCQTYIVSMKIKKKCLDKSSLDTKDQVERDRSIMVYNVLESSAENGNKRMKDDVSFINDFVTEGLHIQSVEIESVARIGKYERNKKRPMKVKFCNRTDQVKVLKNLCNLSEADEHFKICTITIDRNIKQRDEVNKLVEEAKLKSVNSSNKHYLVRGSPFKPYIIEVPKKN